MEVDTHLIRLTQHLDQIIGLVCVGVREQGVSGARIIRATGTSNAMYIVLRVRRIIIIDHKLDIVDVYFMMFLIISI